MKEIKITVNGLAAASIERAERSNFYGVNGDNHYCYTARRNCEEAVEKELNAQGIRWDSFMILDAHSINTDGLKTPYLAEITAIYYPV